MSWRIYALLGSAALWSAFPRPAAAADDGAKVFADSCSPCHSAKSRPLDNVHLTREPKCRRRKSRSFWIIWSLLMAPPAGLFRKKNNPFLLASDLCLSYYVGI